MCGKHSTAEIHYLLGPIYYIMLYVQFFKAGNWISWWNANNANADTLSLFCSELLVDGSQVALVLLRRG